MPLQPLYIDDAAYFINTDDCAVYMREIDEDTGRLVGDYERVSSARKFIQDLVIEAGSDVRVPSYAPNPKRRRRR